MVDTNTNICQDMLEEQPLCVADGCPGTEKISPCCLRKRSLAARAESSPVSD